MLSCPTDASPNASLELMFQSNILEDLKNIFVFPGNFLPRASLVSGTSCFYVCLYKYGNCLSCLKLDLIFLGHV